MTGAAEAARAPAPSRPARPRALVVEFAGLSCTGKSFLMDRVSERLEALGHGVETGARPYAAGIGARLWSRTRSAWWAARLSPDRNWRRAWLLGRILNRGFLMRGAADAPVHLIGEGLFHRVFFSVRARTGPDPALLELARSLAGDAPSRPDLLVHVTARTDVLVDRRRVRDPSRSRQATGTAEVEAEVEETRRFVEPAFRSFAERYGFELLTVDGSEPGAADAVDRVVGRVVARLAGAG